MIRTTSTQHSALSTQHSALSLRGLIPDSSCYSRAFAQCALIALLLSFFLVGCAQNPYISGARHTVARNNAFMTIDLVRELAGSGDCKPPSEDRDNKGIENTDAENSEAQHAKDRQKLACAFDKFHARIENKTEDQKKLERN